ncbi:MAG: Gfo/Idh/MocA family oxidoreductase [Candidatus Latescibacterota bacterium]|nr:Gfo/Idh/MocA family oxidoreductase [Candidatus Latescibacterota bacterium]
MPAKTVRVGIVGMGIGKPNARAIARHAQGQVAALCDLDEERMAEFAAELPSEVKFYTDYKAMCRDAELDAVFVGTPNQWHVPIALEAVRRDKHVLVTKPLADAEKPARRLVDAAERSGVVNMMSLSTRFSPACLYLRQQRHQGFFGELYYARARSVRRNGIPAWNLGFIQEGGGAFRDMGVHVLDAAWSLLGFPRPVSVTGVAGARFGPLGKGYSHPVTRKTYRQFKADDYAGGFIRFEGGIGLQVESFWASHQPGEMQIELFGTEAGASYSPLKLYRTVDGGEQDTAVNLRRQPEAWDNIASHFIDCIANGVPCTAPLKHGLQVQGMMEALLKSAGTGREVRVKGG